MLMESIKSLYLSYLPILDALAAHQTTNAGIADFFRDCLGFSDYWSHLSRVSGSLRGSLELKLLHSQLPFPRARLTEQLCREQSTSQPQVDVVVGWGWRAQHPLLPVFPRTLL